MPSDCAPLDAACAGCLCLFVPAEHTGRVLAGLHAHPRGRMAAAVGHVTADPVGDVEFLSADGRPHTRGVAVAPPPERLL
ncbi:hypothetical protein [Streptomyces sp. NPDC058874]|uniref:hypothetical protein n=1 Tax=unclassified Streptomyces TaxID=2593676 RepID=UPI0036B29E80